MIIERVVLRFVDFGHDFIEIDSSSIVDFQTHLLNIQKQNSPFYFRFNYISKKTAMNHQNKKILDQYTKLQKIGSGLTSTVYKANHPEMGEVCLKVIDHNFYAKPIGKLLIDNEILLLKSFNHKNLLKLKKHEQNNQENVIITDFCDGGNLYELTKKCKKFTQKQTLIISEGIINGLAHLYSQKIIHRDLKPENIFFKKGEPIIADFGFAVHLDNKNLNKVNAGSPLYMAPETLQNKQFSMDSEVFAIGVIIFQMLKGKTPWTAISENELLKNMLSTKPAIELTDKKFEALIKKCLEPKRQKRAKFDAILKFFNEWKDQYFRDNLSLQNVKDHHKSIDEKKARENTKQTSKSKVSAESKDKKKPKFLFKLNIKTQPADKENTLNNSTIVTKTKRTTPDKVTRNRTKSTNKQADGVKTKRNKIEKGQNDIKSVLKRLNPDKMTFMPFSMIEKFKFILICYLKIVESKDLPDQKDIPKSLAYDQTTIMVSKCKGEKQLCKSIGGYVGRMYRLAKNYKLYDDFIKDIETLNRRIEGLCC